MKPGTPAALPPLNVYREADRLALGRWLVSPDHPLTARVVVNRLWQELFGRGIVATSDNFGVRGDRPSHPELLDWLALDFVRGSSADTPVREAPSADGSARHAVPWSIKAMLRQLVLSQTYRQSSVARPDLAMRDPQNVLVARQARLRLSGEAVRDSALAVSGLLNRTIGGPSVKPPQPASVSKEGYRNAWEPGSGADRYRRGLYTFIQRTSPFAQFVTFDLPDTSRSCTRRERSNTPLQALNLLNDPVFLEAAQALATRIHREVRGDDEERLAHAFALVLSRSPSAAESNRLLAYLQKQRVLLANDPASARELCRDSHSGTDAAWIALCSVLLNLDEFINRE